MYMKQIGLVAFASVIIMCSLRAETLPPLTNGAPQTMADAWAGFDPQAEPLDVEILHSYEQGGVTIQVVRYRVGIFNGETAMVAGVYGYPTGQTNLPALLNIHGGGQFATANACYRNAQLGYATLSVAWAGRINAQDYFVNDSIKAIYESGDTTHPQYKVTTDWVGLDQGTGVEARAGSYDAVDSPRNSGWFLWTMAARRGLTFLEQQPEVDGTRLGVYGHSMGGKLTVMTTGTDDRPIAAAPSCGGVSDNYAANALYNATIADSNYLDGVSCPIFFLMPANDFHGRIDDVPQAISQVSSNDWRVTHAPHHNHQDTAKYTVPTLIWMEQYLKAGTTVPASPTIQLTLNPGSGVPMVTVSGDTGRTINSVEVYYTQQGLDSGEPLASFWDATYRHWHYSAVQGADGTWTADLPVNSTNEPLWVYANITYALDASITGADYYYNDYMADEVVLSSIMEKVSSSELQTAAVTTTLSATSLIEDFQGDWEKEWFNYKGDDPNDWSVTTHKVNDSVYAPPTLAKLSLEVKSADANTLQITLNDDATVAVSLTGGTVWQTIELFPMEFQKDGSDWATDFSGAKRLRLSEDSTSAWSGAVPEFRNLQWVQVTQEEYDAFYPVDEFVLPLEETVLYSHDFEDGTTDSMAVDTLSGDNADASLVSSIGNYFGAICANVSYTKTLAEAYAEGARYTLSLDHFRRSTTSGEAITLEIGYDVGGTFTVLTDQTCPAVEDVTTLIHRSISWEATAGGAELGQTIVFRLSDANTGNDLWLYQAACDNIVLTEAAAPVIFHGSTDYTAASGTVTDVDTITSAELNGADNLYITYTMNNTRTADGDGWITLTMNTSGSGYGDFLSGGAGFLARMQAGVTASNHQLFVNGVASDTDASQLFTVGDGESHAIRITLGGFDANNTFTGIHSVLFEVDHFATSFETADATMTANVDFGSTDNGLTLRLNSGGSALDVDNLTVFQSPQPDDFLAFITDPAYGIAPEDQGLADDPDGDRIPNGIEAWFGTHPGVASRGLSSPQSDGTTTTLTHPVNSEIPSGLTGAYRWSLNLVDWYAVDGVDGPLGGATLFASSSVVAGISTTTITSSESLDQVFLRAIVTED